MPFSLQSISVRTLLIALVLLGSTRVADAQFKAADNGKGPIVGAESTTKLKLGVVVKATGGNIFNAIATLPVPMEWPEQQIKILNEDVSQQVKNLTFRDISGGGGLKQMVAEIKQLPAGQEAHALVIYEITRRKLEPPADTTIYTIPKRLDRTMQLNLGPSPMIESKHPKIVAAAKKAVADKESVWKQVEGIYDFVRSNVQFKEGPLKGAVRALNDGEGYTDELVCLFVAMCRSQKIPARTVFTKGNCYAEFYLDDDEGQGHWFPCMLTGSGAFGSLDEVRPALQKGDNFKNPEDTKEKLRYVREYFHTSVKGKSPKVTFISEPVN
jgi:hypothetical protein